MHSSVDKVNFPTLVNHQI